jgi:hypothetical protein
VQHTQSIPTTIDILLNHLLLECAISLFGFPSSTDASRCLQDDVSDAIKGKRLAEIIQVAHDEVCSVIYFAFC